MINILLPDGTYLMHANQQPYDAARAHEYYMQNRKLHPREKSARSQSTRTVGRHKTTTANSQQLSEQKAYAAKRVSELKARLAELTTELSSRLSEARKREQASKKAPTAADKRKAADASKKYRDKHKQEIANKRKKSEGSSISSKSTDEIKKEIVNVKAKLKAAIAAQRQLIS